MIALDTNVLVYAAESCTVEPRFVAAHILGDAMTASRAFLPLQALAEFQHNAVRLGQG